ncbi:uncharacterized protein LOC116339958, partial [Contarinia nasturtii]|uniref:uncharacterized protein LOC116339958 n=1 Tax=Contarinia nasturtii TaxID=265458 RepID=UPI0012D40D7E
MELIQSSPEKDKRQRCKKVKDHDEDDDNTKDQVSEENQPSEIIDNIEKKTSEKSLKRQRRREVRQKMKDAEMYELEKIKLFQPTINISRIKLDGLVASKSSRGKSTESVKHHRNKNDDGPESDSAMVQDLLMKSSSPKGPEEVNSVNKTDGSDEVDKLIEMLESSSKVDEQVDKPIEMPESSSKLDERQLREEGDNNDAKLQDLLMKSSSPKGPEEVNRDNKSDGSDEVDKPIEMPNSSSKVDERQSREEGDNNDAKLQ